MQQVELRVKGLIDRNWSEWLDGLAIAHTAQGETILTGSVRDQSVLYGLLERMDALGMQLISFNSSVQDQTNHVEGDKEPHR
jgi:hypothetical protein